MDTDIFSTDGRLRRLHYLGYMFAIAIVSSIISIVTGAMFSENAAAVASLILTLPLIYVSWCASVRRAHDMGQGATFIAIMYGSLIAGIFLLIVGAILAIGGTGTPTGISIFGLGITLVSGYFIMGLILLVAGPDKANRWGPDPR